MGRAVRLLGTRTTACLFALALLAPFAVASDPYVLEDAAGDEVVRALLVPDLAGQCEDPAVDILGLVLDAGDESIQTTLAVRDAGRGWTCADVGVGSMTRFLARVALYGEGQGAAVTLDAVPGGAAQVCREVRAGNVSARACESLAWADVFVDDAWNASIPLAGTISHRFFGEVPYDLRGHAYSVTGFTSAFYGPLGVLASTGDHVDGAAYQP